MTGSTVETADPRGAAEATAAPQPAADGAAAALRTSSLAKNFGSHPAVAGIDLDVPSGSVFAFLGPNGCGKTTTIRMLLGLITPTAGRIELLGHPMPEQRAACLPHVGALIEGPAYYPYLSGEANLRRFDACDPAADPATRPERVHAALSRVGLLAARRKRFRQYSLGMKQRLAIAGALLQPRRLYILDEPTNGLDPQGAREVRTLVRELAGEGATVLISSHLLSEIEQVATHLAIMSRGRILAQGELDVVLGQQSMSVRVATPDARGAARVLTELRLQDVDALPGGVTAALGEIAPDIVGPALVRAGVRFTEVRLVRPALEDVFVELTGSGFDVAG